MNGTVVEEVCELRRAWSIRFSESRCLAVGQNGTLTVSHGWKPEREFLKFRWEGYDEALLLCVRATGSPTGSPTGSLPNESYAAGTVSYRWEKLWAAVASLPFAPEVVLPALEHFNVTYPEVTRDYGFKYSFNLSFTVGAPRTRGWIARGTMASIRGASC